MRRIANIIRNRTIGIIKYRNNVVTGEVAVDNGNNTYDVYIAGSDVAYPDIPTTLREPSFAVGEAVEILVEYGNKEMPIIIGRSKKVAQEFTEIEVSYSGGTSVTTLDAYSITGTTAYFEGRISIEEMENCTKQGFYYGTTTGYGSDAYTTGSFAEGSYNKQVTGLTAETTYHFQAYVYDADGDEQVGEDKTFTTPEEEIVTEIIAYLHYSGSTHYLTILDLDGGVLYTGVHSATAFSTNNDPVAVDSGGNIYIAGRWADTLKKLDSEGNWVYHYYFNNPYQIAINPDGDIWVYGWPTDNYLKKIDPETLQEIDSILIGYSDFFGMAFDSAGYLYMIDWSDKYIEKWDVINKTRVNYRSLPAGDLSSKAIYSSLAVVGSTVYLTQWANDEGDIFTCPTNLSSDFVANNVDEDFPAASDYCNFITASKGTHIIVEGYVSNVKTIVKYTPSFTRVWKKTMDTATYPGSGLGIAAYPF